MRTAIVILIGLAALAAFIVLGPMVVPGTSRAAAASVFVGVWFMFCVIDWYIGVYHAGYSAMEELRIHAVIFAIPTVAALAVMVSHGFTDGQGYKAMSMKDDLAHRSPDIHWPAGFEPEKADLFAHNELTINASCERVWAQIVDASRWPSWYPNSKDVVIMGGDSVLRDGTVFRWTTFGLTIESTVHEYVANQRLGWYGYAPGAKPSFYHSWYLEPRGGMCHVVMDEAGVGKDAVGLRQSDETLMHRGHDLWLATLKWVAEAK